MKDCKTISHMMYHIYVSTNNTQASRNGSCDRCIFRFWRFFTLISLVTVPVCNPNRDWGFPFSHLLSSIGCQLFSYLNHSARVRWSLQVVFSHISQIVKDEEHFWSYVLIIFITYLETSLFVFISHYFILNSFNLGFMSL